MCKLSWRLWLSGGFKALFSCKAIMTMFTFKDDIRWDDFSMMIDDLIVYAIFIVLIFLDWIINFDFLLIQWRRYARIPISLLEQANYNIFLNNACTLNDLDRYLLNNKWWENLKLISCTATLNWLRNIQS